MGGAVREPLDHHRQPASAAASHRPVSGRLARKLSAGVVLELAREHRDHLSERELVALNDLADRQRESKARAISIGARARSERARSRARSATQAGARAREPRRRRSRGQQAALVALRRLAEFGELARDPRGRYVSASRTSAAARRQRFGRRAQPCRLAASADAGPGLPVKHVQVDSL